MVEAYAAKHLNPQSPFATRGSDDQTTSSHITSQLVPTDTRRQTKAMPAERAEPFPAHLDNDNDVEVDLEMERPPYIHAMLSGGIGGTMGDMLMHSLDTVKTRQQGDPHMPPKYTSMGSSYYTILKQEGFTRGLYGGVVPAFLGSFAGTLIFFGSYEWSKRKMLDAGITPSLAYLAGGM